MNRAAGPGRTVRAFLALPIPEEVKERLGRELAGLRRRLEPARWVRVEGLHLTVKFLGEVAPARLEELCGALEEPLAGLPPVRVELAGAGFFPGPGRPRVAWVGGTAEGAAPIVAEVEEAAARLGWDRERRPWALHLTVARLRSPWRRPSVEVFLRWGDGYREAPFSCGELVMYRSELGSSGAVYTALRRIALGGRGS